MLPTYIRHKCEKREYSAFVVIEKDIVDTRHAFHKLPCISADKHGNKGVRVTLADCARHGNGENDVSDPIGPNDEKAGTCICQSRQKPLVALLIYAFFINLTDERPKSSFSVESGINIPYYLRV
jgi:hypothetical protein